MSALRFQLREAPPQRLDCSPLTPDRLRGLSLAEIARLPLQTTRAAITVGDLFTIAAGDAGTIVIVGGSALMDEVGAGMTEGSITVEGEVGIRAGRGMRGGRLHISGKAGPYAASGLLGGEIEISGDAGDFLGGPGPGNPAGMAGGVVVVRGAAGARAGDRLRRGVIVIEGDSGDHPGSRMLAGTLVICGRAGAAPGYLMRRGTMFTQYAAPLATFSATGSVDHVFRALLARTLLPPSAKIPSAKAAALIGGAALARFSGDLAGLGKGELLIADPAS